MSASNLIPGLMSVTFRSLSVKQIIEFTKQAGLQAIGWSGDVHVPADNLDQVYQTGDMTRAAGLKVASYCSYYRTGIGDDSGADFKNISQAALALGAPSIRVWAGKKDSAQTDNKEFERIVDDSKRIADVAKESGLEITFEYHKNTLTDNTKSALRLYSAIAKDNVKLDWQPPNHMNFSRRLESLKNIVDKLANLHVFHWQENEDGKVERLPLAQGKKDWQQYFKLARPKETKTRYALLEFVRSESKEQFFEDAKTLKKVLENLTG